MAFSVRNAAGAGRPHAGGGRGIQEIHVDADMEPRATFCNSSYSRLDNSVHTLFINVSHGADMNSGVANIGFFGFVDVAHADERYVGGFDNRNAADQVDQLGEDCFQKAVIKRGLRRMRRRDLRARSSSSQ